MVDPILFSPGRIGGRTAPNRFVSQAMEGNDGELGGKPSARTIERYRDLARGGWGAVMVEALSVSSESLARRNQMILRRENLPEFRALVDAFKAIDPDSLLIFQVTHSGRKSDGRSRAVTVIPDPPAGIDYLSEADVEEIRGAFVEGVLLAEQAGADGVDFKLCHGYLGAELLRPANTRNDRWGGSFENRTRFLAGSVRELRSRLPRKDFVLGSRISLYEGIRGGCGTASPTEEIEDLSEMKRLVRLMADLGMDYVNVSAGIPGETSEITRPTKPSRLFYLHQFRYAREVKALQTPLSVIGSAYTILSGTAHESAAENIRKGNVDFVGFGRQSFADPRYPAKLAAGEPVDYCTACSGCTRLMVKQVHDGCIVFNDYYREVARELARSGA